MRKDDAQALNAASRNGVAAYIRRLFFRKSPAGTHSPPPPPQTASKPAGYTPAQQRELEYLCALLFKKKSFVTSGKLQLIGLEKVKRTMGTKWPALQAFVYKVADEVIASYMTGGDIFIRLKDDAYVIIFGEASYAEGQEKAGVIAEEIRERLFDSRHEELRGISVHKHVVETRAADLASLSPAEALAVMTFRPMQAKASEEPLCRASLEEEGKNAAATASGMTMAAAQAMALTTLSAAAPAVPVRVSYTPLWNHQKNAITSYLCHPDAGLSHAPGADHDVRLLQSVSVELQSMATDGRKLLIVCPLRHDTLYNKTSFECCETLCRLIPEEQRKMLIFLVTDVREDLQKRNGYWFMAGLRKICKSVFLETSPGSALDLVFARRSGFEAVGVRLDINGKEQAVQARLRDFRASATAAGISRTFVLNVTTLSMTTSAVCMGFDCLGGAAIHDAVAAPDSIYRYRHEDLFAGASVAPIH